jgi:hypothetical protein
MSINRTLTFTGELRPPVRAGYFSVEAVEKPRFRIAIGGSDLP